MIPTYTCPGCFTCQLLYPNIMAPHPTSGVFVACSDCGAVGEYHPHPAYEQPLREWADTTVEVDVALFRRQLERGVPG